MSEQSNLSLAQLNTLLEDPITPAIQKKNKRLTDFEQGKIALLYEQGKRYGHIASDIGRPKSTIQNFI